MTANPLVGLPRQNTETDIRQNRRALIFDEFQKLLASARNSGMSIQCFDGEQRARIYTLSFMTGLRRKEIGSLTPASFDLESSPPTATLEAACSKHRRKDVQPLHPELVDLLREWLKGIDRTAPLFPKLAKRRTWLMVKKDLERVGIPYENESGIADFHAAGRHTHITELLRNGASLAETRELARHSDVLMTMRYTHIGIEDQAEAVRKLPFQVSRLDGDQVQVESRSANDEAVAQRYDSGKRRPNGHLLSSTGIERTSNPENPKNKTPREQGL